MIAFLLVVSLAVAVSFRMVIPIFLYNALLNSFIIFCFLCGVLLPFIQIRYLEGDWQLLLNSISGKNITNIPTNSVMYKFLAHTSGDLRKCFSFDEFQVILASVEARLHSRHSVTKYLIGILVLLGLLGTFLGLTQTVGSISNTMNNLYADSGLTADSFSRLIDGIRTPLSGMGTAFSSSILGLVCSLILGFLDLQQNKAEKIFYNLLEDELFLRSKRHAAMQNASSGPAYVLALLEQTVEVMNATNEIVQQAEKNRNNMVSMLELLAEKLHNHVVREKKNDEALQEAITMLHRTIAQMNQGVCDSLQNIAVNVSLNKIVEEMAEGRKIAVQELRNEIRMVVKTLSMLAEPEESMSA
jgi:biopolymer transport protein ExbB/TolQ